MAHLKFYSKLKLYLFYFILIILINKIKTDKYFRAYALQSEDIILFSENGIKLIDKNLNESLIFNISLITKTNDLKYIFFSQFNFSRGNYLFCRLYQFIYIISLYDNLLIKTIIQNDIILRLIVLPFLIDFH